MALVSERRWTSRSRRSRLRMAATGRPGGQPGRVLLAVLVLLVVTLGATGYSDRILDAVVNEEMRGLRTSLAQTIHDPAQLEQTLAVRGAAELEPSYGLDQPWYQRLPGMVGPGPDVRPGRGADAARVGRQQPDRGHRAGAAAEHAAAADDLAAHHGSHRHRGRASGCPRAWARGSTGLVSCPAVVLRAARLVDRHPAHPRVRVRAALAAHRAACTARRHPPTGSGDSRTCVPRGPAHPDARAGEPRAVASTSCAR